ncbi:hypothetical protein TNCV_1545081 [Trichonephila clavipes]|nr:hypothetical protein TNCV_1545081 [Trichonephila clavipes]
MYIYKHPRLLRDSDSAVNVANPDTRCPRMPAQVSSTSLDHGPKLRVPSPKALVYLNSATLLFNQSNPECRVQAWRGCRENPEEP